LLADVTPPVALASYAAAAIAKCDPMKVAVKGTQLALTAFLVPYIFVFSPQLLMIGTTPLGMVQIVITALFGMFSLGAGLVGFMLRRLSVPMRLLSIAAGILCVDPTPITDVIGIVLIVLIISIQVMQNKREKAAQAA